MLLPIDTERTADALYVSPHEADVLLSCPGRILAERRAGQRVHVVVLFGSGGQGVRDETLRALEALGAACALAALRPARERHPFYARGSHRVFGRHSQDEGLLAELRGLFERLRVAMRPRHVYLPLAAGGHVDHRLAHEAGLRAFPVGAEHDVMLYEERPAVFVPGTARIRLGQLAAQLPPGAAKLRDRSGLVRFLWKLQTARHLRTEISGIAERLRLARLAARDWRETRAWRPDKALGLRLQPVVEAEPDAAGDARQAALACCPGLVERLSGSLARFEAQSLRYARRLGQRSYAERYWLLLPHRDRHARDVVAAALQHELLEEP